MDGFDQHLRLPLRIFSDPIVTQLMLQDSENMSLGILEKARQNAHLWSQSNYHELLFPQFYQRPASASSSSGSNVNFNVWGQNQWSPMSSTSNLRKSPEETNEHHQFNLERERQIFNKSQEDALSIQRSSLHKHLPVRFNPYQIFTSSHYPDVSSSTQLNSQLNEETRVSISPNLKESPSN
jgi:hypothetical protein